MVDDPHEPKTTARFREILSPPPSDQTEVAGGRALGPAPTRGLRPGDCVDGYTIVRELARGGMGVVYVAHSRHLQRDVALKLLLDDLADPRLMARFQAEAEVTARFNHPNVVGVHSCGHWEGRAYYAMDLVQGENFAQRSQRDGPLAPRAAAELGRTLAEALAHVHAQGVVHRDLKPENVLITPEGRVVLTDFGVARRSYAEQRLTTTGDMVGTLAFMPPEQASGELDRIGPRSDVYALGATLYALLSGQPPLGSGSLPVLVKRILLEDPQPLTQRVADFPPDLDAILLTCLAKNPSRRYASALALAEDLDRFLAGRPVEARPPSASERARRWADRHQRALAALAVGGLLVALAAGGLALFSVWREGSLDDHSAAQERDVDKRQAAGQRRSRRTALQGRLRTLRGNARALGRDVRAQFDRGRGATRKEIGAGESAFALLLARAEPLDTKTQALTRDAEQANEDELAQKAAQVASSVRANLLRCFQEQAWHLHELLVVNLGETQEDQAQRRKERGERLKAAYSLALRWKALSPPGDMRWRSLRARVHREIASSWSVRHARLLWPGEEVPPASEGRMRAYRGAIADFEALIASEDDTFSDGLLLGEVYANLLELVKRGDPQRDPLKRKAVAALTRSIQLKPDARGYQLRATFHYRLQDYDACLRDCNAVLEELADAMTKRLPQLVPRALSLAAEAYFAQGDYERSYERYLRWNNLIAAATEAGHPVARKGMGRAREKQGRLDEALEEFGVGIALHRRTLFQGGDHRQNEQELLRDWARVRAQRDGLSVLEAFELTLTTFPQTKRGQVLAAFRRIVRRLIDQGMPQKALKLARRLRDLTPPGVTRDLLLGVTYGAAGDKAKAREILSRIVQAASATHLRPIADLARAELEKLGK
jgi:serine/threonine protein kinase